MSTAPMPMNSPGNPQSSTGRGPEPRSALERELVALKARLVREGTDAVSLLERALDALWRLDRDEVKAIRRQDDSIDVEEVEIEAAALKLMTLQQPVAKDLRMLAFIMKVNADFERAADHAVCIAKTIKKIPQGMTPRWPQSLRELGERVPMVCHNLLRALVNEDVDASKLIVVNDETIDALHKRLFEETLELMQETPNSQALGLMIYRLGRELERIADLMTNIAEDIVYLKTGQIIRHEKKLAAARERAGQ